MSKAGTTRARDARGKVAAQRAADRRSRQRKRALIAGIGISLVVMLAVVLVLVRPGAATAPTGSTGTAAQDAAVARAVTSVPAATFDSVGAGAATGLAATTGQPVLTSGGKPEVLYMGGEFCPPQASIFFSRSGRPSARPQRMPAIP